MQLYTMLFYYAFVCFFYAQHRPLDNACVRFELVFFSSHLTQSRFGLLARQKIHPSVWVSDSRFSSLRTKLNVTEPGGSRRKTRHYFSFCVKLFEPELQPECALMEIDGVQKPTHCHAVDYKYTLCIFKISVLKLLLSFVHFVNSAPTFSTHLPVYNPACRKTKALGYILFRLWQRLKFSKVLWSSLYKDYLPRRWWTAVHLHWAMENRRLRALITALSKWDCHPFGPLYNKQMACSERLREKVGQKLN